MPSINFACRGRENRALLLDVRPQFCSMNITQEVREFAARQNAGVETFVAAEEAEAGMDAMSVHFGAFGGAVYLDEPTLEQNSPHR